MRLSALIRRLELARKKLGGKDPDVQIEGYSVVPLRSVRATHLYVKAGSNRTRPTIVISSREG